MTVDARATPADRVRLLTVCTGNICRSPYAAALLRHGLEEARPGAFEVTSAGTHALAGQPIDVGSARRLAALGLADDAFRARLLTARIVAEQALVLVMSAEHRQRVLDESPAAHRRTFTIRELAHALDDVAARHDWPTLLAEAGADDVLSRWRALPGVLAAHRARDWRQDRDVVDPYQRGDRAFERMSEELDPAVRTVVAWERQFPR